VIRIIAGVLHGFPFLSLSVVGPIAYYANSVPVLSSASPVDQGCQERT
jgi:hypothetical protein